MQEETVLIRIRPEAYLHKPVRVYNRNIKNVLTVKRNELIPEKCRLLGYKTSSYLTGNALRLSYRAQHITAM
jgi:hypothetical protein